MPNHNIVKIIEFQNNSESEDQTELLLFETNDINEILKEIESSEEFLNKTMNFPEIDEEPFPWLTLAFALLASFTSICSACLIRRKAKQINISVNL